MAEMIASVIISLVGVESATKKMKPDIRFPRPKGNQIYNFFFLEAEWAHCFYFISFVYIPANAYVFLGVIESL